MLGFILCCPKARLSQGYFCQSPLSMIHSSPQTLTHPVECFLSHCVHGSQRLLPAAWGKPLQVTGTFDDDLVAGIGQAVQGAVWSCPTLLDTFKLSL